MASGWLLAIGLDQVFGRHFDAEIDDVEAVVRENDLDEVLADVMHVALDGGEQDLALRRVGFLLHELFEVRDRRFSLPRRFGSTSATISSLALNSRPTSFIPVISGPLMMSSGLASLSFKSRSGTRPFLRAFENVIGEASVKRQVGSFLLDATLGQCGNAG